MPVRIIDPTAEWFSTGDVAKLTGVRGRTVANWIEKKLLPAHFLASGHRRVSRAALILFLKANKIPLGPLEGVK